MRFGPLALNDLDSVMNLGKVMYKESGYKGEFAEERIKFVATIFIASPKVFSYGAWQKNNLVGFMAGEILEHSASERFIGREHFLYVNPDNRGVLAGRGLLREFEKWIVENGGDSAFIDVSSDIDQDKVVKLLTILGYKEAGILMEKDLS